MEEILSPRKEIWLTGILFWVKPKYLRSMYTASEMPAKGADPTWEQWGIGWDFGVVVLFAL